MILGCHGNGGSSLKGSSAEGTSGNTTLTFTIVLGRLPPPLPESRHSWAPHNETSTASS